MYALGLVFGGHTAILCPTVDMGAQESSIEISDPAYGSTRAVTDLCPAELVRPDAFVSRRGRVENDQGTDGISWRVGPQPSHEGKLSITGQTIPCLWLSPDVRLSCALAVPGAGL